jgi:hypothetical protein
MNDRWQEEMKKLLDQMLLEPGLSPKQRKCVERLSQMNWAEDLAALSSLWPNHPDWVERYLDLMVCELHEFPESHLSAPGAAAATAAAASSGGVVQTHHVS